VNWQTAIHTRPSATHAGCTKTGVAGGCIKLLWYSLWQSTQSVIAPSSASFPSRLRYLML